MKWMSIIFLFSFVLHAASQENDYLLKTFRHHKDEVKALAFSRSNRLLATGGEDKLLVIYNTVDGSIAHEHKNLYYPVKDAQFFGDNQLFITAGNEIQLIDLFNNSKALYEGNATEFWSVNFAPERNKITGGSYDTKIKVWDVNTSNIEVTLKGHKKSTLPVCFSPDEKYLLSGSRDQTVKVWNAKTGELMKSLDRHSGNIYDVEFHPNAKYCASASGDKTVRFWDIESGEVLKTYTGHDGAILDIEFSPDGYFLYTASYDGVVMIHEIANGMKLSSYIKHDGPVNAVEVSTDGNFIATGGADGKVFLWESAKVIAVEFYFKELFEQKLRANSISDERKKGESKAEFEARKNKLNQRRFDIADELFKKYKEQVKFRNIPMP